MNICRILIAIYSIFCFEIYAIMAKDDYPQTRDERRNEELGSVLEGRGIIFSPSLVKNESTKSTIGTVNKYLWQAAVRILSFAPLTSIDSAGGVIITEWYSPSDKPQFSFKINVYVKDTVINADAIEVKVFSRMLKNEQWVQQPQNTDLALVLTDKMLRLARELYIQSTQRK